MGEGVSVDMPSFGWVFYPSISFRFVPFRFVPFRALSHTAINAGSAMRFFVLLCGA